MSDHDHTPIGQMPCGCPLTNPPKHRITCTATAGDPDIMWTSPGDQIALLDAQVATLLSKLEAERKNAGWEITEARAERDSYRAQLTSSTALIEQQGAEIARLTRCAEKAGNKFALMKFGRSALLSNRNIWRNYGKIRNSCAERAEAELATLKARLADLEPEVHDVDEFYRE